MTIDSFYGLVLKKAENFGDDWIIGYVLNTCEVENLWEDRFLKKQHAKIFFFRLVK